MSKYNQIVETLWMHARVCEFIALMSHYVALCLEGPALPASRPVPSCARTYHTPPLGNDSSFTFRFCVCVFLVCTQN